MPLSLSDDEYAAVQAAAAPIHPLQRDAFLKALAAELEHHPVVGPGVVTVAPPSCNGASAWKRSVKRRPSPDTSGRERAEAFGPAAAQGSAGEHCPAGSGSGLIS
jgi:hypothetical protein